MYRRGFFVKTWTLEEEGFGKSCGFFGRKDVEMSGKLAKFLKRKTRIYRHRSIDITLRQGVYLYALLFAHHKSISPILVHCVFDLFKVLFVVKRQVFCHTTPSSEVTLVNLQKNYCSIMFLRF